MADYSKEYDNKHGMGFHDFSIKEEFDKLEDGYYISMICEGYGFLAILKEGGVCKVAMPVDSVLFSSGEVDWCEFDFDTGVILNKGVETL